MQYLVFLLEFLLTGIGILIGSFVLVGAFMLAVNFSAKLLSWIEG